MKAVTLGDGIKVYNLSSGKTLPGWLAEKRKKALKKAFELQLEGKGLSFVEVLSMCPTGWSMPAVKSLEWIDEEMTKVYPLGVMKDTTKEGEQA